MNAHKLDYQPITNRHRLELVMRTVQVEYKAYYTTSEVANITGVKPSAIREAKRKELITPAPNFDIAALMFDADEVVRYAATRNVTIEFVNQK